MSSNGISIWQVRFPPAKLLVEFSRPRFFFPSSGEPSTELFPFDSFFDLLGDFGTGAGVEQAIYWQIPPPITRMPPWCPLRVPSIGTSSEAPELTGTGAGRMRDSSVDSSFSARSNRRAMSWRRRCESIWSIARIGDDDVELLRMAEGGRKHIETTLSSGILTEH